MSALRPLRFPRASVALWLLMFAAVAVGSLLPAHDIPTPPFPGFDKLEHMAGYAVLSAYPVLLFATRRARLLAMAAVIAFGCGIEVAQGLFTPTREPDAVVALANAVGAVIGQLVGLLPVARWLERDTIRRTA